MYHFEIPGTVAEGKKYEIWYVTLFSVQSTPEVEIAHIPLYFHREGNVFSLNTNTEMHI